MTDNLTTTKAEENSFGKWARIRSGVLTLPFMGGAVFSMTKNNYLLTKTKEALEALPVSIASPEIIAAGPALVVASLTAAGARSFVLMGNGKPRKGLLQKYTNIFVPAIAAATMWQTVYNSNLDNLKELESTPTNIEYVDALPLYDTTKSEFSNAMQIAFCASPVSHDREQYTGGRIVTSDHGDEYFLPCTEEAHLRRGFTPRF